MILLAIARHEQDQQHYQKIPGIEAPGQQAFEKAADIHGAFLPLPKSRRRECLSRRWRWRRRGLRWRRIGPLRHGRRISGGFRGNISAVAAVALGNISVIHGITCLKTRRPQTGRAWQPAWLFPAWICGHHANRG